MSTVRKLGRTTSQRRAMLRSLATQVLIHGKIKTTETRAKEAKKIVIQGQGIAEKADDIAGNVRDMTTVGGLVKHLAESYLDADKKTKSKK